MISVKSFVDFITTFPDSVTNTVFTSSFPRYGMTSLIGYRNFLVLCTCHVYIIFVNVYFLNLDSVSNSFILLTFS